MIVSWSGWGGAKGFFLFVVLWSALAFLLEDMLKVEDRHMNWMVIVPAIICCIYTSFEVRRIRSSMTEQERTGDTLLMLHHFCFIPFRIHPWLYGAGAIIGIGTQVIG